MLFLVGKRWFIYTLSATCRAKKIVYDLGHDSLPLSSHFNLWWALVHFYTLIQFVPVVSTLVQGSESVWTLQHSLFPKESVKERGIITIARLVQRFLAGSPPMQQQAASSSPMLWQAALRPSAPLAAHLSTVFCCSCIHNCWFLVYSLFSKCRFVSLCHNGLTAFFFSSLILINCVWYFPICRRYDIPYSVSCAVPARSSARAWPTKIKRLAV